MTVPPKLYKYCAIGANSLRNIMRAEVHHAAPMLFNDPLDCNPTLNIDLTEGQMEELVKALMGAHGNSPETIASNLNEMRYYAGESEGPISFEEVSKAHLFILGESVKSFLHGELGSKGVLSLSRNWDEPLMWSHYADQHKGICLEYEPIGPKMPHLKPVSYGETRSIRANDIYQWKVNHDPSARTRVYETYFYSKARQWKYEQEWRDVHDTAGTHSSLLKLTAIHFGMRTEAVWRWMIVKALLDDQEVDLFNVVAGEQDFKLSRHAVERGEIETRGIAQPASLVFHRWGDQGLEKLAVLDEAFAEIRRGRD